MLDLIVVQGHEDDVDDDAERDEELGEGVKDEKGQNFADLYPDPAAVPNAGHVCGLDQGRGHLLPELGALVVRVVVVDVEGRQAGGLAQRPVADLVDNVVKNLDILKWKKVKTCFIQASL